MLQNTWLPRQSYKEISEVCGYDIWDHYREHSRNSGYLRLNRRIKRPYMEEMERIAHECGMRFYVSDADFKERSDGGCCCGLPESWNWSRGQLCHALQLAKKNGRVTWPEMAEHLGYADTFGWRHAQGYNQNSQERRAMFLGKTMYDFLRWNWNSPENGQSPYRFYNGVLKPVERDENGDLVYEWDESRAG